MTNLRGAEFAPLSMAELRASVYGTNRGNVIDFFAGLGGLTAASILAGGRVLHACNHWEKSTYAHGANFGMVEHALGDLSVLDPRRLPIGFADTLVCAPECFAAGALILTDRGQVPIEDVRVGDRVLTHKHRWRAVTGVMRHTAAQTVVVSGEGHRGIETTPEHPFLARSRHEQWQKSLRRRTWTLAPSQWVAAEDLIGKYWCSPTTFGDALPVPLVPDRHLEFSPAFWRMVGRWLGDGCLRLRSASVRPAPVRARHRPHPAECMRCSEPAARNGRYPHLANAYCSKACGDAARRTGRPVTGSEVQITCGHHEAEQLAAQLAFAPPRSEQAGVNELRWHRRNLRTGAVFTTSHDGLARWLREHFGEHAHGKTMPTWALTMPAKWRQALLDGYVEADGHDNGRLIAISSVSRRLAMGVRLLALSLNLKAGFWSGRPGTREGMIEGRRVAMRQRHYVSWTKKPHPDHERTVIEPDAQWRPVLKVTPSRRHVEVFNLSVAEDESYVVEGLVVHNCRRHSNASNWRQAVMELAPYDPRRESERSRATMWCPLRWAYTHRFDFVVLENVVEVTTWNQFGAWCLEWERLGYNLQIASVNSAFFFAPQSRDRVAIVASRKGIALPNLDFRPPSHCWECEETVYGIQTWKNAAIRAAGPLGPVGKYGGQGQYVYKCPACQQSVSPYVVPAITALDPSIPAERIADRKRPLKDKTIDRIVGGVMRLGQVTQLISTDGREGKRSRPAWLPAMVQTGRQEIGVIAPATIVALRRHTQARGTDQPAPSVCAGGTHHALVGPDQEGAMPRDVDQGPCSTLTTVGNHFLSGAPLVGANRDGTLPRDSSSDPAHVVTAAGGGGVYMVGGGRENNVPRDAAREAAAVLTAAPPGGGLFMVCGEREFNIPRDAAREAAATVTAGGGGGGLFVVGANREHNVGRDARRSPAPVVTTAEGGGGVFAAQPPQGMLVQVGGNTFERDQDRYTRTWDASQGPAPTQSTTQERGVVQPPVTAEGFAIPEDAFLAAYNGSGANMRRVTAPAGTQTATDRHAILVPAGGTRQQATVDTAVSPAPTRLTRDSYATVGGGLPFDLGDWTFRMLVVAEAQALMDASVRPDGEPWLLLALNGTGSRLNLTNSDGVRLAGNAVCQTTYANVLDRVFAARESGPTSRQRLWTAASAA